MKLEIIIVFFFFTGCLIGCYGDAGYKRKLPVKKQIVNEVVTNSHNPAVDILFIIDNSGSMREFQDLLSKNAQLFIDEFLDTEFIDYHIAVTTSSAGNPFSRGGAPEGAGVITVLPVLKDGELAVCESLAKESDYNYSDYIDRKTPRAGECLKEMMQVGADSMTHEQFLNIPAMALSGQDYENPSFYRHHAHLAIIVITDSFDQSKVTPEESYSFLSSLKNGDETKLHYAAGLVTFDVRQYECRSEEKPPVDLIKMVKLFGHRGYQFNLCQFDYGKHVARFASHLVDSALVISLDYLPDVKTIEVYYNYKESNQLIPRGFGGWSYSPENNIIYLSKNIQLEKAVGGRFEVKYEPLYSPDRGQDGRPENP